MDTEVVVDWAARRVVGSSTKKQGAELIRADEAAKIADGLIRRERELGSHIEPDRDTEAWKLAYRVAYDRMTVTNTELRDVE
jgi:hypothetical protein